MVSALASESSSPGLSPSPGRVLGLDTTLSLCLSPPSVQMGTGEFKAEGDPGMD